MSVRAPTTAADLGQIGLAGLTREWLYNDALARFAQDPARRSLNPKQNKVTPDAVITETERRDLHAIVHSEDVEPGIKGASYINPFRGRPGEYDPLAENVLRRLALYYADDPHNPHLAALYRHIVLQSILRIVQRIRDNDDYGWSPYDRIAIMLAYLWRIMLYADDASDACFIAEFWDCVSPDGASKIVQLCQSQPPESYMTTPQPLEARWNLDHFFPDYNHVSAVVSKGHPTLTVDLFQRTLRYIQTTPLQISLMDQGLTAKTLGLAIRVRGRDFDPTPDNIGDIVHAYEDKIGESGTRSSRINAYHPFRNDPVAFELKAREAFDSAGYIGSSAFDAQNEFVLQALLPHIIRAFHGCKSLDRTTLLPCQRLFKAELLPALWALFDPPLTVTGGLTQWATLCAHLNVSISMPESHAGYTTIASAPLTQLLSRLKPRDLTDPDFEDEIDRVGLKAADEYINLDLTPSDTPNWRTVVPVFSPRLTHRTDLLKEGEKKKYFSKRDHTWLPYHSGLDPKVRGTLSNRDMVETLAPTLTTKNEFARMYKSTEHNERIREAKTTALSQMPSATGYDFDLVDTKGWSKNEPVFNHWLRSRYDRLPVPPAHKAAYDALLAPPRLEDYMSARASRGGALSVYAAPFVPP
jgi:hypothetical protein